MELGEKVESLPTAYTDDECQYPARKRQDFSYICISKI